ncbi:DDE-type integrase/transposase/recombinase [Bremerella sp. T1]|uniref:DDE-type integrase/transposase/recombinase n=1 Tax=Bremerella sp. TYQ1 TaxID=3119568 RepID=UPI001CCF1D04|nr:DDE-type integrase/transposase/recombinase [Bremerella volcania]UBM38868.1 DDE-type integrase/transposase/recombinase [Bremerella volcania]
MDFIFDRTENGRQLKILSLVDESRRECIALEVSRKLTGDHLMELLTDLFAIRGVPKYIRSDNGPEFISRRVQQFLEKIDVGSSFIEPDSRWQNGQRREQSGELLAAVSSYGTNGCLFLSFSWISIRFTNERIPASTSIWTLPWCSAGSGWPG